jgi:hypothetical protein
MVTGLAEFSRKSLDGRAFIGFAQITAGIPLAEV